jgi:hypothetical protein
MLRFVFLITASLAGATWAAAEAIDVKYYGELDLAPFACTDISRSSFINRACYDKSKRFMVAAKIGLLPVLRDARSDLRGLPDGTVDGAIL